MKGHTDREYLVIRRKYKYKKKWYDETYYSIKEKTSVPLNIPKHLQKLECMEDIEELMYTNQLLIVDTFSRKPHLLT